MNALSAAVKAPERAAAPTPDQQSPMGLDARLSAVSSLMDDRLTMAALAVSVNTAVSVPDTDEPVDLADVVRVPAALPNTRPAPIPCPYTTPAAVTLHQAHTRLETGGWCAGQRRDEDGALCLYGAIHAVAPGPGIEHQALDVLLDAIRRRFPTADSVPEFNDSCSSPQMPLRMLREAADLADARGL